MFSLVSLSVLQSLTRPALRRRGADGVSRSLVPSGANPRGSGSRAVSAAGSGRGRLLRSGAVLGRRQVELLDVLLEHAAGRELPNGRGHRGLHPFPPASAPP